MTQQLVGRRRTQGGCQQSHACTVAHSVHRLHPDAPWDEFMLAIRMPDMASGAPEIMQFVFQQYKSYFYLEMFQLQFIDSVLDISIVPQMLGTHNANCAENERFHGCSSSGGC